MNENITKDSSRCRGAVKKLKLTSDEKDVNYTFTVSEYVKFELAET